MYSEMTPVYWYKLCSSGALEQWEDNTFAVNWATGVSTGTVSPSQYPVPLSDLMATRAALRDISKHLRAQTGFQYYQRDQINIQVSTALKWLRNALQMYYYSHVTQNSQSWRQRAKPLTMGWSSSVELGSRWRTQCRGERVSSPTHQTERQWGGHSEKTAGPGDESRNKGQIYNVVPQSLVILTF